MAFPRWTLSTSSQMRSRPSSRPSTFRIMPETSARPPSPGTACGKRIKLPAARDHPGQQPADNRRAAADFREKPPAAEGQQKGNTEQTTEAGQPGRRGKRTARPQGQKNAGGHGADMGKDPPFRDQANDGFLLAFPTAFA